MQIGKGTSHVAQNPFQALQTGPLAGLEPAPRRPP
jgi:hypothetical protein